MLTKTIDCWKLYSQLTFGVGDDGELVKEETQKDFYGNLAAEMIDNRLDRVATRQRNVAQSLLDQAAIDQRTGMPMSGIGPHLSPTRRKRTIGGVVIPTQLYQGVCVICSKGRKKVKTTDVCSECRLDNVHKEVFLCNTKHGKLCFQKHLQKCHNIGTN